MDDNKTTIADLAHGDLWSVWFNEINLWVNQYLLSRETLIEIGLIILAASIAWPISIFVRRGIQTQSEKYARFALLRRLWVTLGKLSFHARLLANRP